MGLDSRMMESLEQVDGWKCLSSSTSCGRVTHVLTKGVGTVKGRGLTKLLEDVVTL